jgi:hypothetical protein
MHTSWLEIRYREHSPRYSYHVSMSHPKRKEQISTAVRFWFVWCLNETFIIQPLTKALRSILATPGWQFHGRFADFPNLFFALRLNVSYTRLDSFLI